LSNRSFYHSTPVLWNSLPSHLRHAAQHSNSSPTSGSCISDLSPSVFLKKLKSHFFALSHFLSSLTCSHLGYSRTDISGIDPAWSFHFIVISYHLIRTCFFRCIYFLQLFTFIHSPHTISFVSFSSHFISLTEQKLKCIAIQNATHSLLNSQNYAPNSSEPIFEMILYQVVAEVHVRLEDQQLPTERWRDSNENMWRHRLLRWSKSYAVRCRYNIVRPAINLSLCLYARRTVAGTASPRRADGQARVHRYMEYRNWTGPWRHCHRRQCTIQSSDFRIGWLAANNQ
jgi:hypothetical protein